MAKVDNWNCAEQLDKFKPKIEKLGKRIDAGNKYICTDEFEILNEGKKQKIKKKLDDLRAEYNDLKEFYESVEILVKRHESLVNEIARIYVGIREDILNDGKFPKDLFQEQADKMQEFYESLNEILKPLGL